MGKGSRIGHTVVIAEASATGVWSWKGPACRVVPMEPGDQSLVTNHLRDGV